MVTALITIEYKFTEDELKDLSKRLAQANQRLTALQNQKKSATAQFSADIKAQEKYIDETSNKVASGTEFREIQCSEHRNIEKGVIEFRNIDTDEIIKERPMTHHEKQMTLDDMENEDQENESDQDEEKE